MGSHKNLLGMVNTNIINFFSFFFFFRLQQPKPMMAWMMVALVLVAASVGRCRVDSPQKTDPKEVIALNAVFRKWNISASQSRAQWNTTEDICGGLPQQIGQYFESEDRNPYIVCNCEYDDGKTCHITKLKILELGVVGPIPDELQNLTHLENLQIARNYITGPLPSFIGNFSRLQYLSVGRNALSGFVPKELGKLKALKSLGIDTCNFSGPLPAELGNLTYLEQMYIDSMGVSGEIPSTFERLIELQTLWAGDNEFGGRVPEFVGNMTKLQSLKFQGNSFHGPIPKSFAKLNQLTLLYLSDLYGESSSLEFIKNMTLLKTLVLRDSRITDTLPSDFGENKTWTVLDLSFNNLTGEIPPSLFKSEKLKHLYLGSNSLTGRLPKDKSGELMNIDLSYNNLLGSIPSWQYESGLQLNLVVNNFDADKDLPWKLRCLQKSFPCYRDSPVYSYFRINCGGGEYETSDGTYDADDQNLGTASYFLRDDCRWAVSSSGKFLGGKDTQNYIESTSNTLNFRDSELFMKARLSPSSLKYYGLALENGNYTVTLMFAETAFTDEASLTHHGRRIFDIYIQGILMAKNFDIRKAAGNKSFTPVIQNYTALVNSNFLEIHLFWGGKGTTAIPHLGYYGPSISAINVAPNFKPTVSNRLPTKKKKKELVGGIVGGVSSLVIVLAFVILLWRKKMLNSYDQELDELTAKPYSFSLSELKNATEDFSPDNKLGEGGFGAVFKGKLNDGRIVAVKELSITSFQGKKQFITEIATISAVQHRNLVKLLGCCYEKGCRLLVYEFLENRSLDIALYGMSKLKLDWPSRYNICLGTARGLAYLHEESRMRIIHRDVKASNILLDAELNPKISDFGLAKLYDDEMSHVSTKIAGTIGYLAPEYALRGHLTEKADIFGFGIVVLEILTGRPNTGANSSGEKLFLLDWAWELYESENKFDMMDPSLSSYNIDEATRMIGVAFLCTQTDPNLRPPMSRVVAMLVGDMEISDVIIKPAYLEDWKYDEEYYGAHSCTTSSYTAGSSSQFDFARRTRVFSSSLPASRRTEEISPVVENMH